MQIKEIVLYSFNNKKISIELFESQLNIIRGISKSGKSALIDIIDYCLGADTCNVSEGIIREKVSWFGLKVVFPGIELFIARQNPPIGQGTTNKSYLIQGEKVQIPDSNPNEANTTTEAIENLITELLGISPNLHEPPPGQTRLPLSAEFRHALIYCFQSQKDLNTNDWLFHRQQEHFMIAQAIKDATPYFLGAIEEDLLATKQELSKELRKKRRLEIQLAEAESIKGEGLERGLSLLSAAKELGIVSYNSKPTTKQEMYELLKEANDWKETEKITFDGMDRLTELQESVRTLGHELNERKETLRAVRTFASERAGYSSERERQKDRLEVIGLFNTCKNDIDDCPFCKNSLSEPIKGLESLKESFKKLSENLEFIESKKPILNNYIQNLEAEISDYQSQISHKESEIEGIYKEEEVAKKLKELNYRRAHTKGRISLWIESIDFTDTTSEIRIKLKEVDKRINKLEKILKETDIETRSDSILNRISQQMTEWAQKLKIEYSEDNKTPFRFDLKNLTNVVDKADRSIPLKKIGSAENWVGHHLITHLALHQHFVKCNRPVPRFLFLDQPSMAYFPDEALLKKQLLELEEVKDEDTEALTRIFDLIFEFIDSVSPNFQVIVTEHANLAHPRYQEAIRETWVDKRLVPIDWPDYTNNTEEKDEPNDK